MVGKPLILAILIVITVAGFGIYYLTLVFVHLSMTATPTPLELSIVGNISSIEEVDHVKFFAVAGVVQNNHTANVYSVNVTATFQDIEGRIMGTEVGHAEFKIIKPGKKAPFQVYFLLNSSLPVPAQYELTALGVETNEEPSETVEIMKRTNKTDINGYYIINGEIQNIGVRNAFSVKVICAYYDLGGNILAVSDAYVAGEIDGGSKVSFELSSDPHKISPPTYELFVVVHHYELLPIANLVLLTVLILASVIFIAYMKKYKGW